MKSSECESADNTDAEQLATAHCTSAHRVGEGASAPAMAKFDRLVADRLRKKRAHGKEYVQSLARTDLDSSI